MQALTCKIILGFVLLVCGYTDFRYQKIYNLVTIPSILLGLVVNYYYGGIEGLKFSLLSLGIIAVVGYVVVYFHGIGYGDWKMLIAVASLMGIYYNLAILFVGSLVSAIWALIIIACKKVKSVPLGTCLLIAFTGYEIMYYFLH